MYFFVQQKKQSKNTQHSYKILFLLYTSSLVYLPLAEEGKSTFCLGQNVCKISVQCKTQLSCLQSISLKMWSCN